jgi:Tc toxin complex TcA C-terminal TcB-binding domain
MPRNPDRAVRPVAIATMTPPTEPVAFVEHVLRLTDHREEIEVLVAKELGGQPAENPRVERKAEITARKIWQTAAAARLDDIRSNRVSIESERAVNLSRRLVERMSKNSLRMATLQGAERRWHVAIKDARNGIQLRRELPPDARLHLELARSTFMLEGNSPRLREELKTAAAALPASKGIAYWRARYAIMSGHHADAADAVRDARDYPPVRNVIMPLLEPEAAAAPWLSWPCNFYTYRYALATDDNLRGMQSALAALLNNPELEPVWTAFGIPAAAIALLRERAVDAGKALEALLLWNQANVDMTRGRYASAVRNYEACQRMVVAYFAARFDLSLPDPVDESGSDQTPSAQLENALEQLARSVIRYDGPTRHIWTFFRERNMAVTLEELHSHDWRRPNVVPLAYEFSSPLPSYGTSTDFATALARLLTQMSILKSLQLEGAKVEEKIDAPLVAIALVFCPLGIAEANRLRRSFDEALSPVKTLLRRHSQFNILSEVIEKPFAKILKAQILLDKADAQYKARALAVSPAENPDGTLRYQGLKAAETYQGVLATFEDQGQYVNRVNASVTAMQGELATLLDHTFSPIAAKESASTQPPLTTADRKAFALFGKKLAVETMAPRQGEYANPDRRIRPHESLIVFEAPTGETNPAIYALIIQARARLLQMESGLNYLGYTDDYVPPWRFQYLLDRSRYFAEHAKNAQREYLNFLQNAEREDLQEITAAQNVEMEKSNIRLEDARVEQVKLEVESSKASEELARLTAANSELRFEGYESFDKQADKIAGTGTLGLLLSSTLSILPDPFAEVATGVIDFFTGGAASKAIDRKIASLQREYEKLSLALAATEATQSAVVAGRQLGVARQGLVVAGMQRAAAVLRHEFALHNLTFLRNRTLNAELWYRLSGALRGVADTYLRYAIELAFLAEQAYEFEADKRIDVIRFDYDVSDLGDMLAGDFLLRDLDTLEQDLIVGQRNRQQQVRYVLSLAREYPEALQQLREDGHTIFSLRLEQIERRFPGLFNVRVAAVDVLPLALMDNSRFSLELTHLGTGQVRLKADPTTPETAPDWLSSDDWSVRHRVLGPESAVYSGLSKQELAQGTFASTQRGAFEGRPGASMWRIDMSMRENRVVPDTLADVVLTFTLTGYHDATLRAEIDRAPERDVATTLWLSARQLFPDSYYQFHQTTKLEWEISPDSLALQGSVGELQNVAVVCAPAQKRPELGRTSATYSVEFELDAAGQVRLLRALPRIALSTSALTLSVITDLPGATISFDCGDGTGLVDSAQMPHVYARPGRYEVLVRIAVGGRLTEYRAAVVVSRDHATIPPCVAVPTFSTTLTGTSIDLIPTLDAPTEPLTVIWRVDGKPPAASGAFALQPGRHVLQLLATRPLRARFYSQQRFEPSSSLTLDALRLATNRTFDVITGTRVRPAVDEVIRRREVTRSCSRSTNVGIRR